MLQIMFGCFLYNNHFISSCFNTISIILEQINLSTNKGTTIVFGKIANLSNEQYSLILHGLPVLITISALSSLLTYWKILPAIINIFALIFKYTLRTSGTLGFAISTNIFAGMSETPVIINSYLKKLTRSEIFTLIVCGMSSVASSVMAIYIAVLESIVSNPISHIISAVLLSIPGSLTVSRIIEPPCSEQNIFINNDTTDQTKINGTLEAICTGILDGTKIIIIISVMIIGFTAIIDLTNYFIFSITSLNLSIEMILGWIFYPIAWLIGIPQADISTVAPIFAIKVITNEILAFQGLAKIASLITMKSTIMMVYALSSFSCLSSVGVVMGIYTSILPDRKKEIVSLGYKALVASTLVNLCNASIIGLFIY